MCASSSRTARARQTRIGQFDATNDDDRAAVQGEIEAFGQTKRRMYAGKNFDGEATLTLADGEGRNRLTLSVDSASAARIAFLDEAGNVVREIAP